MKVSKAGAIVAVALMLQSVLLMAAEKPQAPQGPVPTQIATAKRVFIANGGGDEPAIEATVLSGGPDRAYNQFYAAMKTLGRYELVGSPAEADLLFEIRYQLLPATPNVFHGDTLGAGLDPQIRLEIRDPKTNALLWGFTEHVQWAMLQGNRDKNFDAAVGKIAGDVQALSARSMEDAKK